MQEVPDSRGVSHTDRMRWIARTALVTAAVLSCQSWTVAQRRTTAPTFEPGDTEGLVVSPNPQIRHAWKRKVFWRTSVQPPRLAARGVPAHSAAERTAMNATLDALTAQLKATPTGRDGEGFWVLESRTLDYVDVNDLPERAALATVPLHYESGLFPFYHEDVLTNGQWRLSRNGETESVYFEVNALPGAMGITPVASEPRGRDRAPEALYLRPRITATWRGLPVYENQVLVVARAGRDPWVAVPVERALKAVAGLLDTDRQAAEARLAANRQKRDELLSAEWEQQKRAQFEKQNGELQTTRPSNYAARLRSLEHEIQVLRQQAQADADPPHDATGSWYWNPVEAHTALTARLAALTPADAGEPACVIELPAAARPGRTTFTGAIVAEREAPGCRQLVRTNWEYFDTAQPRTAPQILTVRQFGRCAVVQGDTLVSRPVDRWDHPPQGCVQHAQMWREADWAAIAAIVVR